MKITKIIAIGLFVVAMVLNVSVYVDSGNSQKADLSIGDLQVSLFEKAYASEYPGSGIPCWWQGCNNGGDYPCGYVIDDCTKAYYWNG